MQIGGLVKFSLSDYPGYPCGVIFCQGCNFRCPFCHNGDLLPFKAAITIPEKEVMAFLDKRKNILQAVVISGGEPTLQADLPDFISRIKSMGYKVKLDTNGSNPATLATLLDQQLLDFIAMDIKAPKDKYNKLCGVKTNMADIIKSIQITTRSKLPHLFRTTWVKSLLTEKDIKTITSWLPDDANHTTQKFRPETALTPGL